MSEHSCVYPVHIYIFNLSEVENIHPRNRRNVYVRSFVEPFLISWGYQTLFLCKGEAYYTQHLNRMLPSGI